MNINDSKVDDAVLALLYLNQMKTGSAWKQFDWDATDRLHESGCISDPKSKTKSVLITTDGEQRAKQLLAELFGN